MTFLNKLKSLFGIASEEAIIPDCYRQSIKCPSMCKGPYSPVEYAENDCERCDWYKGIDMEEYKIMRNPKLNNSGYRDMTAYEAIKNADKPDEVAARVISLIKQLASICGFEITERIVIKNKTTGKEYR